MQTEYKPGVEQIFIPFVVVIIYYLQYENIYIIVFLGINTLNFIFIKHYKNFSKHEKEKW